MTVKSNVITVKVVSREVSIAEVRLEPSKTEVYVGEEVGFEVTVTVSPAPDKPVSVPATVYVNGEKKASLTVSVPAGGTTGRGYFNLLFTEPRTYEVYVETPDKVAIA